MRVTSEMFTSICEITNNTKCLVRPNFGFYFRAHTAARIILDPIFQVPAVLEIVLQVIVVSHRTLVRLDNSIAAANKPLVLRAPTCERRRKHGGKRFQRPNV